MHTLSSLILCMAWDGNVDYSILNPSWLDFDVERRTLSEIIEWKEGNKDHDIIMFTMSYRNGFFDLYNQCLEYIPSSENWQGYVEKLQEEYEEKKNFDLQAIVEEYSASDRNSKPELIKKFIERLENYEEEVLKIATPSNFSQEFLEKLEARRLIQEPEMKTGFPTIDNYIWGLHRGEVLTIGARTGKGKSVFLLNIAITLLKNSKKVLFFSTEMSAEEKWARLVSNLTDIEAFKFRRANFNPNEWKEVSKKVEWLADKNHFIVCDIASPSIVQIKELVKKVKPDVVMLDYLGMFTHPENDRKDLEVGEFMKGVKIISRDCNVAMLVTSQLNRQVDAREKQIPTMSDLKESGSIEQESDIVFLLYDADTEEKHLSVRNINLLIEKNRHGKTGIVNLIFNADFLKLRESERVENEVYN